MNETAERTMLTELRQIKDEIGWRDNLDAAFLGERVTRLIDILAALVIAGVESHDHPSLHSHDRTAR